MDEESLDELLPEDQVFFSGKCTCNHEEEEHTWGECGVEGCECEAGWEI